MAPHRFCNIAFRQLLKHYPPRNIGIYGCSSGGMLTAEAVAWFQKEKLPRPGAIGLFCSSTNGLADSPLAPISP
jgi:acetyl esterase/lipase